MGAMISYYEEKGRVENKRVKPANAPLEEWDHMQKHQGKEHL